MVQKQLLIIKSDSSFKLRSSLNRNPFISIIIIFSLGGEGGGGAPFSCNIYLNKYPIFFVCFVALRPKSTAMVMAGRSVHLITLFPGQA